MEDKILKPKPHLFKKGQKGIGGRKKGSLNKKTIYKNMILEKHMAKFDKALGIIFDRILASEQNKQILNSKASNNKEIPFSITDEETIKFIRGFMTLYHDFLNNKKQENIDQDA